jgi:ribosome-associated toxin RatA of RatAB toxin-antitoxin module
MKQTNEIVIRAPLKKIFTAASDLSRWPEFLPHYRYNRFLSQTPSGGIVKMSCLRSGLPTTWVSEYRIDTQKRQLHFHHLKSALNATAGMNVVWDFKELRDGSVRVTITHDLHRSLPLVGLAASDWLIGKFFIHHIATKTLAGLKRKVEAFAPMAKTKAPALKTPKRKTAARKSTARKTTVRTLRKSSARAKAAK